MEEEEDEEHHHHSNSRRLQIRRGILRHTTTLRSSPYNPTLSNLRRRQTSLIASQTINHLLTNIENTPVIHEEILPNNFLVTSDDDDENENFDVLVDFSNTNNNSNHEQNQSYHSLSTIDFDDDDDDDDDDRFYYTSPVFDYSSSTEPLIVHENEDEDLSIEIILETSQTNSLSSPPPPPPRRRRSLIPSNHRGLHLSDILTIPQKLYNTINEKHQQTTQCYICLEDFQSIDLIKILNCQHIFHTGCINQWLRAHSNCAYCRTPVLIDLLRTGHRRRTRPRRNHNSLTEQQQQP